MLEEDEGSDQERNPELGTGTRNATRSQNTERVPGYGFESGFRVSVPSSVPVPGPDLHLLLTFTTIYVK